MTSKQRRKWMGQVVVVNAILDRISHDDGRRTWEPRSITLRAGWIVGFRSKCNGRYLPPHSYGDTYEPPCLQITSTVPCTLIAFEPGHEPIPVPMDAWTKSHELQPTYDRGWTDKARAEAKEWVKECARGSNGQFCQLPAAHT